MSQLTPHFLGSLLVPVAQTIGMACAGMLIALVLGLALAVAVATQAPGARAIAGALAALRAIPDLTLAILAVVLLGLGPAAGIAALAVFYTAMVGKVSAELLLAAPPPPIDALRATGTGRVGLAAFGLIPVMLPDLLSFDLYAFECAMRASIVVGAVGAGGIGTELVGAINALDYARATAIIVVLIALIAAVDTFGIVVRRYPRSGAILLAIGLVTLWIDRPQLFALGHAFVTFGKMLPPQLSGAELAALPHLLWQTAAIAIFGTALGALLGFTFGLAAARTIVPLYVVALVRRVLDTARAIPEVVWGLILVVSVGVGPVAGILALGLHSGGVLGKLYAEAFENVERSPVASIVATGASKLATVAFAIVPLAWRTLAVHTLFRLEWNVRAAAVVGMIGAGGIGQALFLSQQLFFYKAMTAYVLITWAIVLAFDALSERSRAARLSA
ncbi:MAG: ABC transporter permease subunit [Candidatus Eremiobacteraeota bacterium]|nr:ABC transporter permease subunit [Candidatus Eremiobacteraeota bacterium]